MYWNHQGIWEWQLLRLLPTAQYLEGKVIRWAWKKYSSAQFPKVNNLVGSLGQDICRVVSDSSWKLPRHILFYMALRHWFRSSQLTTLLNKLRLETAITMAVENTSTFLSPQIVRHPDVPFVFHSDFDNYDQLLNEFCGMVSVHTSYGIMLQDFDCPKGASWPWLYGSWIYNYICNLYLSSLMLWVRILLMARCITVCDKVCQWLAAGRWFSPGPPVSSTNKTNCHDIAEILLKVALSVIKPNQTNRLSCWSEDWWLFTHCCISR